MADYGVQSYVEDINGNPVEILYSSKPLNVVATIRVTGFRGGATDSIIDISHLVDTSRDYALVVTQSIRQPTETVHLGGDQKGYVATVTKNSSTNFKITTGGDTPHMTTYQDVILSVVILS